MTTYTSADLAEIAASIPSRASEAGLLFIPGVHIERECDVRLSAEDIDVEQVIRVAAQVGASFVALQAAPFYLNAVLDELVDDETHSAESVQRLKESAQPHDGSLENVTVSWAAQGLIYEWTAATAWGSSFLNSLFAAVQQAEAESEAETEAEREEHREQYRAAYQAALSALLNSPKYRGESIGKRRLLVSSILAEAGVEEMPEVFMTRQVQPDANRIIGEKAYEYEQDFRARKSELADELRTYPAWQRVYTQIKRKAAAAEFLMKKADGYRLSTDLAGEISEAAANPVYVSRY
ncbi:hypothetical protein [Arthrobacter sp. UYEF3]|uniref:hypothetical protein n=1 Tax=Arthrobacter sp. UYEF3 TaxID=1756365 RepID=UPI00339433C4